MYAGAVSRASRLPLSEKASHVQDLWIYGYGIFQGAASVTDQLVVFFTIIGLGAAPSMGNITDAIGNSGFAIGSAVIATFIAKFVQHKGLMALVLGTAALPVFIISSVSGLIVFWVLVFCFEALWGPVNSMAQAIAMQANEKTRWGTAFARLNQSDAMGSMSGLAIAGLWMSIAQHRGGDEPGARGLFILLGVAALSGAFVVYRGLVHNQPKESYSRSVDIAPVYTKSEAKWLSSLLSDQLILFYVLSFVLFLGLGMSYSGILTFMVGGLHFPIAGALIAMFFYKAAVYFTSQNISKWIEKVIPLQIHSLISVCRAILILLLAIMALLMHSTVAFPAVVAVILVWGGLSAVLSVTGLLIPATMAQSHRQSQALSIYNAICNGAVILGSAMAGGVAAGLGFPFMFLIAAGMIALSSLLFLRI